MLNKLDEKAIFTSMKFIKQKEFWIEKLESEIENTKVFIDSKQHNDGGILQNLSFDISGDLANKILKIAKQSDVSLYIILLTSLKILLYRYTENQHITVKTSLLNQNISEETLNNLVVIKDQINSKSSFKELLLEVRQSTLEAFENQDYPIEKIFEYFKNNQKNINTDLSKVIFISKNIQDDKIISMLHDNLAFLIEKNVDIIQGQVVFDSSFYEIINIERMIKHLIKVTETCINDVDVKICDIDFMSDEEKKYILYDLNNTKSEYAIDIPIHKRIEKNTEEFANHTAVVFNSNNLTYKELNEKANTLANKLVEMGVVKGQYIPILMKRGFELPISMLAVMKAGAVFVPIEINWPINRINEVIEDLNSNVLLYNNGVDQIDFDDITECKCYLVDNDKLELCNINPDIYVDLEDSIYVIYTSGSTGKPKGAINKHKGILNRFLYMNKRYQSTKDDVVMLTSNHAFDAAVWQIFWPLINGIKTVIPKYSKTFDLDNIIELISCEKVTITDFVPPVFNVLVDIIERDTNTAEKLKTLRQLLIGGEAMSAPHIFKFKSYLPNVSITNTYGPAETSIGTIFYEIPETYIEPIPIGRPIDNVKVLILDKDLNVVPIGVSGELYIGGECVGLGYVNDEEKTNKVFIKPPISNFDMGIFYKTGDKASYRLDGNIDFLGRIDSQVKIRGMRVELGEIELELIKHESIKEATVILVEDEKGNKCLGAYIVPVDIEESVIDEDNLRDSLSKRLPEYMIPSYFIKLDKIPLTSNGKVNRSALQKPDIIHQNKGAEYVGPTNEIEEALVQIWQELLEKERIGINDSFFSIGGDSIKTIQIASRMRNAGYLLEIGDIFIHPTIKELAKLVKPLEKIANQDLIIGDMPLTPIQHEFFESEQVDKHHFNQGVILKIKDDNFNEEIVKAIFGKIQEHHDILRTTFDKKNNQLIGNVHAKNFPVSVESHNLRNTIDATNILNNKINKISTGIDLEKGPLMKLGLFYLDNETQLVIIIHHLIVDGISWRILFEDIHTLYEQYKNNEVLKLPLKSDSFKVWSEMLQIYANSETFINEKEYWIDTQKNIQQTIKRDFDGEHFIKDENYVSFNLSEEETHNLLTKCNMSFGTEINDILLTALSLSLKNTFGVKKAPITLEGHGREKIDENLDVNRTIGWFTSSYPVVLEANYDYDLQRQIMEIKEYLHKIPNKGIGYGILKYLSDEEHRKDVNFNENPQILFNYLGQFDYDLKNNFFEISKDFLENQVSNEAKKQYDIEISSIVYNKMLQVTISFSNKQYKEETIKNLSDDYKKQLVNIICICLENKDRVITPSDLGYKDIKIDELKNFF